MKIKGIFEIIERGNGNLLLFNTLTGQRFLINGNREILKLLFKLFDGTKTKKQIIKQVQRENKSADLETIENVIQNLERLNIFDNFNINKGGLRDSYLRPLERQIKYFSAFETSAQDRYHYQGIIKKTKITILGLGHIGHWVALSLIASGFTNLKIVDFDIIEKKNVPFQILFNINDIGRRKVDVVIKNLKMKSRELSIKGKNKKLASVSEIKKFVKNSDIVIQCCDVPRVTIGRMITEACTETKIPMLFISSNRVGPFYIPDQTACGGCLEETMQKKFPEYGTTVEHLINSEIHSFPELAVLGANLSIIGVKEIISHTLRLGKPKTYNAIITSNPLTLDFETANIERQLKCKICGRNGRKTRSR